MAKYDPLREHLALCTGDSVHMNFAEIESVIGKSLPPAAFAHRAWWSNNPRNSVITYAWLEAGFVSAAVDMERRTLTFRRDPAKAARHLGHAEAPRAIGERPSVYAVRGRHPLIGALKGTIRILPGTDLTQPAEPDWGAAE